MCFVDPIYLTHAIKHGYFGYLRFQITDFWGFKTGLNHKIRQRFKNNNKQNQVCNEIPGSIDKKSITTVTVATELCKFGKLFAIEREWNPKNFNPTDETVFGILSPLKPSLKTIVLRVESHIDFCTYCVIITLGWFGGGGGGGGYP